MTKTVRDAFLLIMFAVMASLLYFLFFGFYNFNDEYLGDMDASGEQWKGALFYMAEAVQTGMSKYYYDFCYLPTFKSDYYVDTALGDDNASDNLLYAPTDLSPDQQLNTYTDSTIPHYSTGWE